MQPRSILARLGASLAAALLFALSGAASWAVANDYAVRGLVPKGASVAGQDLSGMTEAQARDAIRAAVAAPMLRPLTVSGDGRTWTFEAKDAVSVDVETMLDAAYYARRSSTLAARVDSELRGVPLPVVVPPRYSVDRGRIAAWVAGVAKKVDRKAVDSTRDIVGYSFRITPSADGARVDQAATVDRIAGALDVRTALSASDRTAALKVAAVKPKVVPSSFGTAIIVSLADREIRLFDGDDLVKTYSCAPGQPDWPTPTGDFTIVSKQKNAPWINPHSDWSKNMPDVIPGGPDNPMGDTKIGIDYPGVYMHSVPPSEYSSIGSYASHGCMRMLPSAVHDLYRRVHIGERVYIRS